MLGNNGSSSENVSTRNKVLLETSMGNITIQLRDDMPITTGNFKNLVQQGAYDGTIFHRVIADFMIQGGDPNTNEKWSGGTVPNIQDEYSENSANNKHERGTVGMAKTSDSTGQVIDDSGSSQFFINVVYNSHLDNSYTVFGEVVEGINVVDEISEVATSGSPYDKPVEDVTLIRATLID